MRLLISGGRHFDDAAAILSELGRIHAEYPVTVLIHGGLPAVGATAEDWARQNGVHIVRYPANWSLLGKQADAKRNQFMLEDSRPDALLALPGGRHVQELVRQARAKNIPVVTTRVAGRSSASGLEVMPTDYCADSPESDSRCQTICFAVTANTPFALQLG